MLKNYFKIAWRNLWKNKSFSFINISGLAIDMASAVLILLWINHELTYDMFHEKKDNIYQVWNRSINEGKIGCWNVTPKVLATAIKNDFAEAEHVVRVNWSENYLVSVDDKKIMAEGMIVDDDFMQVFSFPLVKGNAATALNDIFSVVITEKMAKKFFGDKDPMGKSIRIDNRDNFIVKGILKDIPDNTKFQFDYLIPWSYLKHIGADDTYWGNNSTSTYVLLKSGVNLASVDAKMKIIRKKYDKDSPNDEMFLYPASRWLLYSSFKNGVEDGGIIDYLRMLGILGGFILLIACINFMNLSTARSEKRAREVGIRKAVGARKQSLVWQFLGESVLLSFIAGAIAWTIVRLTIIPFGRLTGKVLTIDYYDTWTWVVALSVIIITGIIAGSYPAFFLASFKPVKVLKGTIRSASTLITPRKVLVVFQFTIAIVLIICTIIVKQQINFAQERQLGYNKANLGYHNLTGDIEKNYSLIKKELLSSGIATSVSKTSAPITEGWSNSWGFEWVGKPVNDRTAINRFCADDAIGATTGFQFVAGRDFDLNKYTTDSTGIILNESAVKLMGFKNPVGQVIKDNGIEWHVIGVIKDFILESPYRPITPMAIEGAKGWFNVMHIKLNKENSTSQNLTRAEAIFKKYNPEYPFEYHFVDEEYDKKFKSEARTAVLTSLFSGLTIFISCLGLFGLATYMAENRIKEIGVRKVLGASVAHITSMLSKDFAKLVVVALLIAIPIAWWLSSVWLESYSYRTPIRWWVFVAAGLSAIIIALITVSWRAIKAALANPVKSLRTE